MGDCLRKRLLRLYGRQDYNQILENARNTKQGVLEDIAAWIEGENVVFQEAYMELEKYSKLVLMYDIGKNSYVAPPLITYLQTIIQTVNISGLVAQNRLYLQTNFKTTGDMAFRNIKCLEKDEPDEKALPELAYIDLQLGIVNDLIKDLSEATNTLVRAGYVELRQELENRSSKTKTQEAIQRAIRRAEAKCTKQGSGGGKPSKQPKKTSKTIHILGRERCVYRGADKKEYIRYKNSLVWVKDAKKKEKKAAKEQPKKTPKKQAKRSKPQK